MDRKHTILAAGHKFILPCSIFLIGAAVRLFLFGKIPAGCQMDEAYGAWNAFSLYHCGIDSAGHSYPVYFEAWGGGQNALNSYLMLPLIAFFDGHVNAYVIRLPQVLLSLATIVAVYFLAKKIFDSGLALWAMFLVSICPWHIMMSRWGLESNLAPGFLILGLCFFLYGLERSPLLLLSAFCYGFSLYSYATIWPIVPVMIGLQTLYCMMHHRIKLSKWTISAAVLLGLMAAPLICFFLVNMGILPSFTIGPFSIYRLTYFRSGELAQSFADCYHNLKNMGRLFLYQDNVRPFDIIMPYGFFYDLGRFFIAIGIATLLYRFVKSIVTKKYDPSTLLLIQLFGAGLVGILITVSMTQINCAYIPLMITGAVGIVASIRVIKFLFDKVPQKIGTISSNIFKICVLSAFLYQFANFSKEYFTDYRELVNAYFQEGTDEGVKTAYRIASKKGQNIVINDALKYPNVLLSLEISAKDYLQTAIYSDTPPTPSSFRKENVTLSFGIDLEHPNQENVYLIYMTDLPYFEGWESISFGYWMVVYTE